MISQVDLRCLPLFYLPLWAVLLSSLEHSNLQSTMHLAMLSNPPPPPPPPFSLYPIPSHEPLPLHPPPTLQTHPPIHPMRTQIFLLLFLLISPRRPCRRKTKTEREKKSLKIKGKNLPGENDMY